MSLPLALLVLGIGLFLVIYFSEQLVKGLVGTAYHWHVSAFLLSILFIGFDPENLGVGATGNYQQATGIAVGSLLGSAMVAIALAPGITAIFAPVKFKKLPKPILILPLLTIILFSILAWDGMLGRIDGFILLIGYGLAIAFLIRLNKQGVRVEAGGEVAETLEEGKLPNRWKSIALFVVSLVGIIGGSELVIEGSSALLSAWQVSETFYGMTILAFAVSIEEVARELPAALKGKPDITLGNIVGSVLAFFLFNAGIIGLVRPLEIGSVVLNFYLPATVITVVFLLGLLAFFRKIPVWGGVLLIAFYTAFVIIGYGY